MIGIGAPGSEPAALEVSGSDLNSHFWILREIEERNTNVALLKKLSDRIILALLVSLAVLCILDGPQIDI